MKKMIVGALSIVTVLMVSSAFAADHGNLAIGYDGGLSLRMFMTPSLGLEGIFGMRFEGKNEDRGDDNADFDLNLAANVIKPFKMTEKANLNLFAGMSLEKADTHTKDAGRTNLYFNAGLAPEIFFIDHLSVEAKFGGRISIIGKSSKNAKDNCFRIGTFGVGVGGAAFHWYF